MHFRENGITRRYYKYLFLRLLHLKLLNTLFENDLFGLCLEIAAYRELFSTYFYTIAFEHGDFINGYSVGAVYP